MKFLVLMREVHVSYRKVEASTYEEAIKKAANLEGDLVHTEYSHTMPTEHWTVESAD